MKQSESTDQEATGSTPSSAPKAADGRARKISRGVIGGAVVAIFAWLAIGGVGGPLLGKLSSLQQNDNASFLPDNVESTEVQRQLQKFTENTALPIIVVAEKDTALAPTDIASAQQYAQSLPQLPLEIDGSSTTLAPYLTSDKVAAVPSQDGKAFLVVLSLDSDKVSKAAGDTTPLDVIGDALRENVEDKLNSTGYRAYVTGPGGFISDLINAFAGIDGILLFVALGVVLIILVIVYRSPVLPFTVLFSAVMALAAAGLVVYAVANAGWITITGQSQGILSILVVGASTDYALLMVSRYKEELHNHANSWVALKTAWRATIEPIMASGLTVILGLLMLLFAELKGTAGLGPVAALGILGSLLSALTLLPAMLLLGRRWIFWPMMPKVDHVRPEEAVNRAKGWGAVAAFVGRHPRGVAIGSTVFLVGAAAFLPTLKADGISQADIFRTEVSSVTGQKVLAAHFDAGAGSPVQVLTPVADQAKTVDVMKKDSALSNVTPGLVPGAPPKVVDGKVVIQATLTMSADTPEAADAVSRLRESLDPVAPDALVGGTTATNLDVRNVADRDALVVMPAIIVVVFFVLMFLLRSVVAAGVLIAANILSFAATIGISAIMFNHVFKFAGGDPTTFLFGFVFLVALGVDYSIFLMSRAREEVGKHGPHKGVLLALALTGGVITSAGIVLASTFGALVVIPLVFLAEISFIVAFGVLLDTFVVRSLLVPSVSLLLGRTTWWPGRLSRLAPADDNTDL